MVCNLSLSACAKGRQWELAAEIFSTMPVAKVSPDVVTFSSLANACAAGRQWALALHVLEEMSLSGVEGNSWVHAWGWGWLRALALVKVELWVSAKQAGSPKRGGSPSNPWPEAASKSLDFAEHRYHRRFICHRARADPAPDIRPDPSSLRPISAPACWAAPPRTSGVIPLVGTVRVLCRVGPSSYPR